MIIFGAFNFRSFPRKFSFKAFLNHFSYSIHERVWIAPSRFASVIFRWYGQVNLRKFWHDFGLNRKKEKSFRLRQPSGTISC